MERSVVSKILSILTWVHTQHPEGVESAQMPLGRCPELKRVVVIVTTQEETLGIVCCTHEDPALDLKRPLLSLVAGTAM
jgi:hypothetical protein